MPLFRKPASKPVPKPRPATSQAAAAPANPPRTGSRLDVTVTDQGLLRAFQSQMAAHAESARDGNGVKRAARLLLALGADQAAQILKELEPREIERVMTEMSRIDHITGAERREILADFDSIVRDFEAPVRGGVDQARKILELSHGEDRASEILGKLTRRDLYADFSFLEKIEPAGLAAALAQEHAQIAAVALSFLKPRIAANVMRLMPDDFRAEIALRLARTARIHPEAVQRVAQALREKFEKRATEVFSEIGGTETLASILNHMDRRYEDEILGVIERKAPDLIEDVKDRLYTFEELLNLEQSEMRLLIARINDDMLLAAALRGAGEEIRRHCFNSMSQNRAADVLEEMDRRGPISVKEINEARAYVLNVARKLDEEGEIVIKKGKEEWI